MAYPAAGGAGGEVQADRAQCFVGVRGRYAERVAQPGVEAVVLSPEVRAGVVQAGVAAERTDGRDVGIGRQVEDHVHVAVFERAQSHAAEGGDRVGQSG